MTPTEKYDADVAAATYMLVYFVFAFPVALALGDVAPWSALAVLVVAAVGSFISCLVREWARCNPYNQQVRP